MTSVKEILLKVNLIQLEDRSNLYLYGDPSINYSDNKNIILATIKYTKDTSVFLPRHCSPPPSPLHCLALIVICFPVIICMCVLFYTIFPFFAVYCAVCSVQCAVCSVQCAACNVLCVVLYCIVLYLILGFHLNHLE